MDNPDIIRQIAVRLDDTTLELLSHTSAWEHLRSDMRSQYFWFLRTENLVGRDLEQKQGDWKSVYYAILDAIERSPNDRLDSRAYNSSLDVLKNPLALEVVLNLIPIWRPGIHAHDCVELGYADSLRVLLAKTNLDPSQDNNILIRTAARLGRPGVVAVLLADKRVDPSADMNYAIIHAVAGQHANPTNYYLDEGQPPTEEDYIEVVRLLLTDPRVDPSVSDNQLIEYADIEGKTEIAELLLTDPRVVRQSR